MNIKESIKKYFIDFYGKKYANLINERINNLFDVIFYDNHTVSKELSTISDYLDEYGISKYRKEIINKEIPFSEYVLEHSEQGTMFYLKNNKLKMVIYFPKHMVKQHNYDCVLIHEFLHVLDEHIIFMDKDNIISQGGFETTVLKGNKTISRDYEFINEIINQRIAEELNEFLYDKNIMIINTKEEKNKSINEYKEDRCEVIEDFYNYFKDRILIDKMTGNIDNFIHYVGEKQFNKFNTWINEFYNKYTTPKDRINNNTQDYKSMINEGLEIVKSMKRVNKELKKYIEEKVFPKYDKYFAHGMLHINNVIDNMMLLADYYNLDVNMAYTIAAYHDSGLNIDRDNHEYESGRVLINDKELKKFFTDEQLTIMKEAIEDHRGSRKKRPRNFYGECISDSDRDFDIATLAKRQFNTSVKNYLELKTFDEHFERCHSYICKRINDKGKFNLWTNNPILIERRNKFQEEYLNKEYAKSIYKKEWNKISKDGTIDKIKNYYEDY